MSRAIFSANNKVGQVFSFQTNVTSGSTFDPTITFVSGSDRVSWDLGNGKLVAGNSLSYTFTGDTGTTKTIKLKTNRLSKLRRFQSDNDGIIDNLNLTKWVNLGGIFDVSSNPNLTGVTHTASTQIFTQYYANNCNLTGNYNLSMFPNLGGGFFIYSNPNLTGITHTASTQTFSSYDATYCGLKGNHDLSKLTRLGGAFYMYNNPNLTGVTHTASTQTFTQYAVNNCNLMGFYDVSMLTGLSGQFTIYSNSGLTNVFFPKTIKTFNNTGGGTANRALAMHSCNLDYIDFNPLSGATIKNASIGLEDNSMLTADVNHILDDFKTITVANSTRWSGVTLNIGGTNQNPDTSSGGYDGLAAITTLTGSPYSWSITY